MSNKRDGAESTRQTMQLPTTNCSECGTETLKLSGELCSECFEIEALDPLRGLREQFRP